MQRIPALWDERQRMGFTDALDTPVGLKPLPTAGCRFVQTCLHGFHSRLSQNLDMEFNRPLPFLKDCNFEFT